mmetsp:Transcript_3576/g.11726  ORF Transcript_3576/g.11726 Transcript_3576/m.11726 type:complete len:212 (-) Transcript_3576:1037-1672(-)
MPSRIPVLRQRHRCVRRLSSWQSHADARQRSPSQQLLQRRRVHELRLARTIHADLRVYVSRVAKRVLRHGLPNCDTAADASSIERAVARPHDHPNASSDGPPVVVADAVSDAHVRADGSPGDRVPRSGRHLFLQRLRRDRRVRSADRRPRPARRCDASRRMEGRRRRDHRDRRLVRRRPVSAHVRPHGAMPSRVPVLRQRSRRLRRNSSWQ